MADSKIDILLEKMSGPDREVCLDALVGKRDTHTAMAEQLGVSEAAVRRWRAKHEQDRTTPKILIWDIESSPILGYTWGLFDQNVLGVVQDWKLLTVSWTWYGSGEYHVKQLNDFKGYRKGSVDDRQLAQFVRDLLDEADYSVAHNGNAFDVKKVNAKFAEHQIPLPSPHVQIDTLQIARRNMKMSSNRLDALGVIFGLGRKVNHSGFSLWLRCMAGEKAAWAEMAEYARQDVVLLEAVFTRLLPWVKNLNYGLFNPDFVCTNCGCQTLVEAGYHKTAVTKKVARICTTCGTWNKHQKAFKQPRR